MRAPLSRRKQLNRKIIQTAPCYRWEAARPTRSEFDMDFEQALEIRRAQVMAENMKRISEQSTGIEEGLDIRTINEDV